MNKQKIKSKIIKNGGFSDWVVTQEQTLKMLKNQIAWEKEEYVMNGSLLKVSKFDPHKSTIKSPLSPV